MQSQMFDFLRHRVICSPNRFQTPHSAIKDSLFPSTRFFASSSLLHHFLLAVDVGTTSRAYHPLYNDLRRRTQGNSLLLKSPPSLTYPDQHIPFASLLLFFLDGRMGWQRIHALWHQDWTDMWLD
jgi:hypothetical protein